MIHRHLISRESPCQKITCDFTQCFANLFIPLTCEKKMHLLDFFMPQIHTMYKFIKKKKNPTK